MNLHTPTGRRRLGLSLATLASLQWGTQPVILAILVGHLEVYALGWMRFATTTVLLLPLVLHRKGIPSLVRLRGRPLVLLLVCVGGLLTNYLAFMTSLVYVSPGSGQVMSQLGPVLMLLGSLVIFGETFSRLQSLGFVLLITGLSLFFGPRYDKLSADVQNFDVGFLLLVLSAVMWGVYLLAQKQLQTVLHPETILLCIYVAGSLILLPAVRFSDYSDLGTRHVLLLAITSIMTFSSYMCYAHAAEHVESSRIGVLISLSPVVTFVMASLLALLMPDLVRPEKLVLTSLGGATLVIAGSVLSALGSQRSEKQ